MRAIIMILLCLFTLPAMAQVPPTPTHHPIKEIEQKLKDEQTAKQTLEKEMASLEKEIGSGKKSLVELADDIQKNESDLTDLEVQLKALQVEKDQIQEKLGVDQDSMADLILALQRIRRIPPEALLAKPGAPLETAQSAMLLQSVLPNLYSRAEGLKKDIARLADIVEKTEKDKKSLETKTAALALRRKEMNGMLDQRQNEYKQAQGDIKQREADIQKISAQASGLKDLLKKLDEKNKEEARAKIINSAATRAPKVIKRDSMPKAGSGQLPVSGIVRVRYGERDDIGAKAEGIRVEARNGALVVSPMGGIVRYTGDFRNYGQMVIIEHPNNYHSLVAGLARIDTVVGQLVAAGEPLGTLGAQGGEKPSLYYELRLDGQPINPARKIGDLD